MPVSSFSPLGRLLASVLAAGCMACAALAQRPPASSADSKPDPNAALLAKASQLYYSSAKTGLKGFDCQVHTDWRGAILSASPRAAVADDDPRLQLLNAVAITLHGRLTGGSSLDWNPPSAPAKPLDREATDVLDLMHKTAERSLTGFMQFWAPFIDGSVIPASEEALEITRTDKGVTIHANQEGTAITEVLDDKLVMQQFNVVTGGAKINFSPRYKATDQGLLANGFEARIHSPSDPPDQVGQMNVDVEYKTISGFPIPSRIIMEVVGTEKFDFMLDGCTVNPPAS